MSSAAITSHDTDHHGAPPATCRFGMIIFLLSEAMLFAGLIAAYIVVRGAHPGEWPPEGAPPIQLVFPPTLLNWVMIVNSALLISSSFTFHWAEAAIKKGRSGLPWLFVTIALGAIFLTVQGWEWMHLKHEGMWFPVASDAEHTYNIFGVYGSTFFAITGFHGAHVFVGLLLILWCALKQLFTNCFTPQRHAALENVGIYWHFVDAVWIVVYLLLYVFRF